MKARGRGSSTVQAWIEPVAEDVEAVSAHAVARERLAAGRGLLGLRRMRVFEISGELPDRAAIAGLLHRSTQFYNPAKERCSLRCDAREKAPLAGAEVGLLVVERGGERRPAAERWWRHETGSGAEIREGVAWLLRFSTRGGAGEARDLAILRDRGHGLLCNPHWQDARIAAGAVPLPWMAPAAPAKGRTASKGVTAAGLEGASRRGATPARARSAAAGPKAGAARGAVRRRPGAARRGRRTT